MAVSENEIKYPLTTGFIYSTCAKRLKERKLALSLTDSEIAAGDNLDRKVVNRIINGTRTRNNPFLIPPAYVKPLVENLMFASEVEMLWGDINDEGFIETLFCHLVNDVLDEDEWNDMYFEEPYWSKAKARVDIMQKVLLDSVAYARVYPTVDSSFEYESPEGILYPISPFADVTDSKQVSPSERRRIRDDAIRRLFQNTRPIEMFRAFFEETNERGENKGYSRLDKRLEGFLSNNLIPFMKDNMPDEKSLGLRVYAMVEADMARYVETWLINAQRAAAGFDSSTCLEHDEILKSLIVAGRDYIEQIEGLQVRLDVLMRKEKFGC